MPRSGIVRFGLMLALAAPLAFSTACATKSEIKHSNVKAGAMPAGGDWSGVYYSQLYGYLHIVGGGNAANGAWRTTAGDSYGEMHGELDGDLYRYAWVERRIGAVGADANRKGSGYFRYVIPKEGEAHEIIGEWGLGDSDAGNAWKAVKQKNMQPNPASVKPDEIEGRVQGVDSWDSGESGSGKGDDSGDKSDKSDKSDKKKSDDTDM
jgi:hypothetical protein